MAECFENGEYRKVAIREDDISAVVDCSQEPGDIGCKVYLRSGRKLVLAETAGFVLETIGEDIIGSGFPGKPSPASESE